MSEDFDDLIPTDEKFTNEKRESRTWTSYARIDQRHKGVDVDEWDALISTAKKPKAKGVPAKQKFQKPRTSFAPDDEFADLLDGLNEEAKRLEAWKPVAVTLGQAVVRCKCCGAEEVQSIGVFLTERHIRTNAVSHKRIVGRISDYQHGLPREVDTLAFDTIPECPRCFALEEHFPVQFDLPLNAYVQETSHIAMLCNAALDMRVKQHGEFYTVNAIQVRKD